MSDKLQEYPSNGENHQDSRNAILQQYQFAEYLNKEIDNLREEIKRPGWTNYAILISIATLVWTLLYCFETGGYSIRNVAFLILGFSLSWELITALILPKKPPRLDFKLKRRFVNRNILSSNKLPFFLFICRLGFFLFVSLALSRDLGIFTMIFTSVFLSIFIFCLLLAVVVVNYFKFPIPMSPPRKKLNMVINTIIILSFLVIIFRYLSFSLTSPSTSVLTDIRLALLIVAIFHLFIILIRVPQGKLMFDSLVMTRRELALSEISLDTARIYTDVALTGFRTSDVLEEYLAALLSLYRESIIDLKEISRHLKDIEILYSAKQAVQEEQSTLVHPLLENVAKKITEARYTIKTRIPKASNRLRIRVFWISSQVDISGTIDEIDRKLGDVRKGLDEQIDTITKRLEALKKLDYLY